METSDTWTSQNGQQEGTILNANEKYSIRREKIENFQSQRRIKYASNKITRRE